MPIFPTRLCVIVCVFTMLLGACRTVPTASPPPTVKPPLQAPLPPQPPAQEPAKEPAKPSSVPDPTRVGKTLFARRCAACHKAERLPDRRASRIRSAARQFPIMYQTRTLSDEELQKIAVFLASKPTPVPAKAAPAARSKKTAQR